MTSNKLCVTVKSLNKTQISTKKAFADRLLHRFSETANGKELSFNNIRDADAAIRIIRDFKERPTVVASNMNPWESVRQMTSRLLGIMLMSLTQCLSLVELLFSTVRWTLRQLRRCTMSSLEIIIAPSYTDEALAILTKKKKNLRILVLPFDAQDASEIEAEYTGVVGGLLVQNQDVVKRKPS